MAKRSGRKSSAQTPAPKSDKIVGSNTNKKGSATSKGASSIKLSEKTVSALKTKLEEFKKKYPKKDNVSLSDLKAVYRRGSGAYSGSHRPNVSRAGWSYGRTNKFLEKAAGKKVKAAYVQDDDLLKYEKGGKIFNDKELLSKWKRGESIGFTGEAHLKAKGLIPRADGNKKKSEKYMEDGGNVGEEVNCRNCGWHWNTNQSKEYDKYVCHKCGFDNAKYYESNSIDKYEKGSKINNMEKNNKAIKNKKPDYYEKYKGGAYLKKGGQLNPDDKSTKDFYAHKSGNAGGMLVGKRHSEGGIKAVNNSSGQPLEMEGGETVITRNAVSDNTKREFEGEMLTNRQILSKINVSGGGVSFADGGNVPTKCACSGKQYKYGGDLLPDYHIVDMLGGQHEYFDSLLPSEAFNKMFDFTPKFEEGGTMYEEGGMIRLVSKKVPSLQEYISKNFGISKGLEKKTYKNYLFSTYKIVFDKLPTMVKNGLLMGNQKLVDKYING